MRWSSATYGEVITITPIVMSETEEGARVVAGYIRGDLATSPFYTLSLAARYTYHALHEKDVLENVQSVAKLLDSPSYLVDTVLASDYKKKPLRDVRKVQISNRELDAIRKADGRMKQKVLFTLLFLAKYHDAQGWENRSIEEVFSLANVSLNKERMCYLLHDLAEEGFISFSGRVSSTNIHVDFIADKSEYAIELYDHRNLGWQYEKICGKKFSVCEKCGVVYPFDSKHVLCRSCRGGNKYQFRSGVVPTKCEKCGKEIFVDIGGLWYGNLCEDCRKNFRFVF